LAVVALVHFWENSQKFRDIVNGVFEAVKAVAIPILEGIMDTLDNLKTVFKGITDFLKGVFTGDFDLAMQGIKGILSGAVNQMFVPLRTIKKAFINFFSLDTVQTGISIALDAIMRMFKAIPGRVASFARGMFDAILTEFAKVANGIINLYNKIPILPDVPTIAIPQAAAPSLPSSAAIRERSSALSGTNGTVTNNYTTVQVLDYEFEGLETSLRTGNRTNGDVNINTGIY
jgi:hypothetical protein